MKPYKLPFARGTNVEYPRRVNKGDGSEWRKMSYTIIFQTKFVKLPDGRFIHLSREGCNNDTEGREKGVYGGQLFTEEEFASRIKELDFDCEPPSLKLGSKFIAYKEYVEHLKRMKKRALTWDEIKEDAKKNFKHIPYVRFLKEVEVESIEDGSWKTFAPNEWMKVCYNYLYDHRCFYKYDESEDIHEIVRLMENDGIMEFHVA